VNDRGGHPDPTRILAIRHGETAWNVDGRIQGHMDVGLNDTGRWQAQRLAQALTGEAIDAIYASDLGRALETAQALADAKAMPVSTDTGLRERAFGKFEGKTFLDAETLWPEQALRWRTREPHFVPDGGESLLQFRHRVQQAVGHIARRHPGEQVAIVSHGGVLDVLYRWATGQEMQAPRSWELGNASINRLLWTPDTLVVVGWSDTGHLQDASIDETTA
jgi:probable phosphoglycerate mutase